RRSKAFGIGRSVARHPREGAGQRAGPLRLLAGVHPAIVRLQTVAPFSSVTHNRQSGLVQNWGPRSFRDSPAVTTAIARALSGEVRRLRDPNTPRCRAHMKEISG